MITFERAIRVDCGLLPKIYLTSELVDIYHSQNNASYKISVFNNLQATKTTVVSYCDQTIKLSGATLYRIRNNIIIKKE